MPTPESGESRKDYISRCVREVRTEEPDKPLKECLAKCYGMWKSAQRGGVPKSKANK